MAYVKMPVFCIALLCVCWTTSYAQTATDTVMNRITIPVHDFNRLDKEYAGLSRAIQHQSDKVLQRMQRQEDRLQRKLAAKDSLSAQALFTKASMSNQYLESKLQAVSGSVNGNRLKEYLPGVDSVQTALRFLSKCEEATFSTSQLQSLQSLSAQLNNLQNQLQQANTIQAFVQQRQQQLLSALQSSGLAKSLTGIRKTAYYYQAQIQEYKNMVKNPDKLASKILTTVRDLPSFQHYMQNNSYLSTLFRVPGSDAAGKGVATRGLQTRDQVAARIAERLGPGASFPTAVVDGGNNNSGNPLDGSMQQAQDQLNNWKTRISQYGSGNSSAAMPDFQPNPNHTKTFLKRIQLSFDMTSQQSAYFLPALSILGLNIGYKLNAKSIFGCGITYSLGWGQPFNHIALSSQGAGLRSFINWKIRGSTWISGGYEANYLNALTQIAQLKNLSAWQQMGLVGLMKTYMAGRKQGSIQLLYDILHNQHIPPTQPFVFRVGYAL
jgi:hypothetical protein